MRKFSRILARGIAMCGMALVLAGCSGTTSSGTSFASFVGPYSGSFSGSDTTGAPVSATFTANVAGDGTLTGAITENGTTTPATGTVNPAGFTTITATGGVAGQPSAFTTVLTGTLQSSRIDIVGTGTFTTTQGGVANSASGRWTAVKAATTASEFQGVYTGTFTGSSASESGTLTLTVDANGTVNGTFTQPGVGTYSVTGLLVRNGLMIAFAVGAVPGTPPVQFVSTLNGLATLTGTSVTATGSFQTVKGNQVTGSGTFTATRA